MREKFRIPAPNEGVEVVALRTELNMGNIESIFRSIFNIEISSIFRWFSSIYRHLHVESVDSTSKGYDNGDSYNDSNRRVHSKGAHRHADFQVYQPTGLLDENV